MADVEPGFRRKRKIYKLVFTEGEHAGLVVRAKGASIAAFEEVAELADMEAVTDGKEAVKALRQLVTTFFEFLISWNLEEEDGTPVPLTIASLLDEDPELIMEMVGEWTTAVASVKAPLVNSSTSGEMAQVAASLQMESLSPNPLSLAVPS